METIRSFKNKIVKILKDPKKSLNDLEKNINSFESKFSEEKEKNISDLEVKTKGIKDNCLKDDKIIQSCNLYLIQISDLGDINSLQEFNNKQKEIKTNLVNLEKKREKLFSKQKTDFTKIKLEQGLVPALLDFLDKEMPVDVIIDLLKSYLSELKE